MISLTFPATKPSIRPFGGRAIAAGISLRNALDADLPWIRDLYASTRAEELAAMPWADNTKRAFLDSQFSLQHQHFVNQIPDVDFWVVEQHARPIGRYYVSRNDPLCIVDISLLPTARGNGVGAALISDTMNQAQHLGYGVMLHVLHSNFRAAKLYEKLGFVQTGSTGSHAEMRWHAPAGERESEKIR